MSTENTSLKDTTPAGDSTTINELVIRKIDTKQHTFLIVACSLLAFLVLIAVAGTSGGQFLTLSATEIAKGSTGALAEHQVDTTNSGFTMDIFGLNDLSKNDEGCGDYCCSGYDCCPNCICLICIPF